MTSRRLVLLDALRGLAALAVVLSHLAETRVRNQSSPGGGLLEHIICSMLGHGRVGVVLFFASSGFCIHRRRAKAVAELYQVAFWSFMVLLYALIWVWTLIAITLGLAGLALSRLLPKASRQALLSPREPEPSANTDCPCRQSPMITEPVSNRVQRDICPRCLYS